MNLSECSGCVCSVGGAVAGGAIGLSRFGWVGALIGASAGFIAGWIGGVGIVSTGFFIGITKERLQQHHDLQEVFGRYWSKDRSPEWDALTTDLSLGDSVSGKVVRQYYHGVFIDIGRGFPALLSKLLSEREINDPQPSIGDTVSAFIKEFNTKERYIKLTQHPEWDRGRPTSRMQATANSRA
jgi:S1 RNA binding domain